MTVKLIQISDCHLFDDPRAELQGVCTRERFDQVLEALSAELATTDRLIVTGDLAHDHKLETYRVLSGLLGPWLEKARVIPGNHDDRDAMRCVFVHAWQDVAGRNVFGDKVGGWTVIGLDSQLTGLPQGRLDRAQLEWLEQRLATAPDSPTVLFLHHPPVDVGSAWVDAVGLEDAAEFVALIRRCPQVRLICAAHVHQEMTSSVAGRVVLTTPATGFQFRPATPTLVVDTVSPGYRVLELEPDGMFRTRVIRVPAP